MKYKNEHISILLTIIFICCLIVSIVYIQHFSGGPIVRLYKKKDPNICNIAESVEFYSVQRRIPINFQAYKIEVADGYVAYLYRSDPQLSPSSSYVQFVNGTHRIDSATTTTDGIPLTNIAFITIENESNTIGSTKTVLRGVAHECIQPLTRQKVVVYEHCNYQGYEVMLEPGRYTLAQLNARGIRNEDLSAIFVENGYTAYLYEHDNFKGRCLVTSMSLPCLVDIGWGTNFNDTISSIIVTNTSAFLYGSRFRLYNEYPYYTHTLWRTPVLQVPHWSYSRALERWAPWIWNSSNASHINLPIGSVRFEHIIGSGYNRTMWFNFMCDNTMHDVYINEQLVFREHRGNFNDITSIPINIKEGINLLSFSVYNSGGTAAVVYTISEGRNSSGIVWVSSNQAYFRNIRCS